MTSDGHDESEIDAVLDAFLAAFTVDDGTSARLEQLRGLFVPGAVVVKACGGEPEVMDVDSFIEPRERILTDGTFTDFREWKVSGRIDRFGDIAQWFGAYRKKGVQHDEPFSGAGMKSVQLARTAASWRITAVAWDDERDGLAIPGAE